MLKNKLHLKRKEIKKKLNMIENDTGSLSNLMFKYSTLKHILKISQTGSHEVDMYVHNLTEEEWYEEMIKATKAIKMKNELVKIEAALSYLSR